MPHLIPEQRPDRNGKLTTRWVRSDSTQPSQTLPSTPPAITSPDLNSVSESDVPLLHAILKRHFIARNKGVNVTVLNPRAARAIEHIITEANEHSQLTYGDVRAEIMGAIDDASENMYPNIRHDTFVQLNNIAALYIAPPYGRTASFETKHYANGLRMLESNRFEYVRDFLELPEDELNRARALCKVIDSIDKTHVFSNLGVHDMHYCALYNDELAEYVLDHPDIVDDIIDIVNDRGITDVAAIRTVLESKEPALRDGLL